MTRPFGGAALLALALAGCGGGREAAASIPRERFVAANVALRSVPDSVGNAAALRQAALRKHRVDEKALKGFVTVHGRDAEYMAGVWREIAQKVDSAYERTLAASRGEEPTPGDMARADSGDPRPPGSALSRLPPGVVGETRTLERPSEMPPPPPGVRGIPREVAERMRKRPVVRPGQPPRPERADPSDARPRDTRPSLVPPPRPDSAPQP